MSNKVITRTYNGNNRSSGFEVGTSSSPSGEYEEDYDYDAANRLTSVTQGGNTYAFEYDGMSRCIKEKLNGAEIRHWIWDAEG